MKKVFEPVNLKNLVSKNRLVRSDTWEGIANPDGNVTEEAYAIYSELAKGGVFLQMRSKSSAAKASCLPQRAESSALKQTSALTTMR